MGIVKATKLIFDYITRDEEDNVEEVRRAINNLNIDITQGDFVAVLGHNGSGKSTFAKHLNGILLPTEGTVFISDLDTANDETLLEKDGGNGIPKPGQSDYRKCSRGGCSIRTGKYRYSYR